MKLIKHLIVVDVDNEKKLLVNSLNGVIDQVSSSVCEIIDNWKSLEEIEPQGDLEKAFFDALLSRGYLVENYDEELKKREKILSVLREDHKEWQKNPKRAIFVMTYNCNFRCPYCFEGESVLKKEIINPEQIDVALSMYGDNLESILLFGGEPLMPENRPSLEYLISKTSGKVFSMFTNGYYLLEFFDILHELTFESITVTLDGDEEAHNSRRFLAGGGPTFHKILQGIERYLEGGIKIVIRINMDASNFDKGNALRDKLLDKFSKFGDLLCFEIGPMLGAPKEERMDITTELYRADLEYSYEERAKRNVGATGHKRLLSVFTSGAKQLQPSYSFCSAHVNTMAFDPYGNIYSCLVAVNKEELAVGTYYPEISFKENSMYTRNIETIPECKECIYALLCGGGCAMALPPGEGICRPACAGTREQVHTLLPRFFQMEQESRNGKN